MGAGLSPQVILIVGAIAAAIYVGGAIGHGAKVLGHKTKCGVMRVVGKHCAPTVEPTDTPKEKETE